MADINTTRPEFVRKTDMSKTYGVVEKPLSVVERVYDLNWLRKSFILIILAAAWQAYAVYLNNILLFPTLTETIQALIEGIKSGGLLTRAWFSIKLLLQGYALGLLLAAIFTGFAIGTRIGQDFLETLTSMFNPLPAIALLPLSLLWFGLGNASLIFVLIHSVLWAVALNTHSGFKSVPPRCGWWAAITGSAAFPTSRKFSSPRRFRASSPASRSAGRLPGAR